MAGRAVFFFSGLQFSDTTFIPKFFLFSKGLEEDPPLSWVILCLSPFSLTAKLSILAKRERKIIAFHLVVSHIRAICLCGQAIVLSDVIFIV